MSSRQFWSERKNLRFTNKQLFLRYPFPYHSHAICPFSVPNLKFLEQCLIFYDAYFIIDTKLLHLSIDDKICSWSDPFCWYCILLVMFLLVFKILKLPIMLVLYILSNIFGQSSKFHRYSGYTSLLTIRHWNVLLSLGKILWCAGVWKGSIANKNNSL